MNDVCDNGMPAGSRDMFHVIPGAGAAERQ